MTIQENFPVASWTVGSFTNSFPVSSVSEDGGNRIVARERPYRDGEKLDDTGSKAKVFNLEVEFENTIQQNEPGLENEGRDLYPEVLDDIIRSFDEHEVGDLVIPTVGRRRCRAESYRRMDTAESRDNAKLSLTFKVDNEDSVNAQSFAQTNANSNARALATTATFTAQSDGMWNDDWKTFAETTNSLEAIANSPGDTKASIEQTSNAIIGSSERINRAFSSNFEGRDGLNDPANSASQRKILEGQDMAARAKANARKGRPPLFAQTFENDTSLFVIAGSTGSAFSDLDDVNPQLENPLFIPKGTPVNTFEDPARGASQR